jgi:hypothetical protein
MPRLGIVKPGRFYVPLDVNYQQDPKISGLPLEAEAAFVRSLAYSKRMMTDGVVVSAAFWHILAKVEDWEKTIEALEKAGLWIKQDEGWLISGWHDWNETREAIEQKSAMFREAGRRGGKASGVTRKKDQVESQGLKPSEADPSQRVELRGRVEEDEESEEETEKSKPFERDFDPAYNRFPKKGGRVYALKQYQARRREGVPAEDLLSAVEHYAVVREGQDQQFTLAAATFFGPNERWKDYLDPASAVPAPPAARPDPLDGMAAAQFQTTRDNTDRFRAQQEEWEAQYQAEQAAREERELAPRTENLADVPPEDHVMTPREALDEIARKLGRPVKSFE